MPKFKVVQEGVNVDGVDHAVDSEVELTLEQVAALPEGSVVEVPAAE